MGVAARQPLVFSNYVQVTPLFLECISFPAAILRTALILPPITAHIWCNAMEIPEIVWDLKAFPKYREVIIAVYLSGIAAFIHMLQKCQWTETNGSLHWPSTA